MPQLNTLKDTIKALSTALNHRNTHWIENPRIAMGALKNWIFSPIQRETYKARRFITQAALVLLATPIRILLALSAGIGVVALHAVWRMGALSLLALAMGVGLVALPFLALATLLTGAVAQTQSAWWALQAIFGAARRPDPHDDANAVSQDQSRVMVEEAKQQRLFAGSWHDLRTRVQAASLPLHAIRSASPRSAQKKLWNSTVAYAGLCAKLPIFALQQLVETVGNVLGSLLDAVCILGIWGVRSVIGIPRDAAHAAVPALCTTEPPPLPRVFTFVEQEVRSATHRFTEFSKRFEKEMQNIRVPTPPSKTRSTDPLAPLHSAAEAGNRECAQRLVEAGHDVNAVRASDGATPLLLAAENNHTDLALFLIEQKADVHAAFPGGDTALHWAAEAGNDTLVASLIDHKAPVNARTTQGETPLDWSIKARANQRVLDRLCENGATSRAGFRNSAGR